MYIYIYIYIYIPTHTYINTHTQKHFTCSYMCICVRTSICMICKESAREQERETREGEKKR